MEVELNYVSVGCNRTPQSVDWYGNCTLAYGAANSVALAEVTEDSSKAARVFATLHAHKDRVNCVTWIRLRSRAKSNNCPVGELLSGSVDNTVTVWKGGLDNQYMIGQILEGHTSSVTAIAATYVVTVKAASTVMASSSSDSTVMIWQRDNIEGQFLLRQTISFGRGFIMALDFYLLPECDVPLLACGGDDSKLHLFTPSNDGKYYRMLTLSGHEDWIRSVSMIQDDNHDILIASCGQDMFIRVWRLSKELTSDPTPDGKDELKVKKNSFTVSSQDQQYNFVVGLETVLLGHEDWVYSVRWQPPTDTGVQPLRLLSASMDKTMILWQPDADTGVWLEQVRVGEVGGNTLGLYGAIFSPHGNQILAHSYQGAFHLWKSVSNHDDKSVEQWEPWVIMGGHFGSVVDISWEPHDGHYLVSVSTDQTARLHAMWKQSDQVAKNSWYEISRPQIHGYDMHCVAMVTPFLYVSGAEEKVIRVFQSPAYFLECLKAISGVDITKGALALPLGASVPPLGLSNKAVYTGDPVDNRSSKPTAASAGVKTNIFTEPELPSFEAVSLKVPPFEDHLIQNTLWPEVQKLYAHGFEVFCVAANHDGSLVASASKAAKQEHASIRIWDVSSWCQRGLLTHHTLTVTQLRFSHNGTMLLAVSRDRCWSLWKRNNDSDKELFSLAAHLDPKSRIHSRIIWSCSWSHDDKCFVTASRDKKVIIWSNCDSPAAQDCHDNWKPVVKPLECSDAATAVDFAPCCYDNNYLLAVGLDDGIIFLCHFDWNKITISLKFNQSLCHVSTVKRLAWQPQSKCSFSHSYRLASCSNDHCVKIFNVFVKL